MEKLVVKDLPVLTDKVEKGSYIIYIAGIVIILGLFIFNIFSVPSEKNVDNKSNVKSEQQQNIQIKPETTSKPTNSNQKSTLTDLIIKPLAESYKFRTLIEYLFYLIIWVLLWLIIPSAFSKLKRFKLFNLEIELDRNQIEVISVIDQQMRKFKFLTYLMKEENKDILKTSFNVDHPEFKVALEFALEKMQTFYLTEWDEHISFEVLTEKQFKQRKLPKPVKNSLDLVNTYQIGVPINKHNPEVAHQKNYLVYKTIEEENIYTKDSEVIDYVILISSYRTAFNENDGYLVSGITSLISELHQRAWENLGLIKLKKLIRRS